MSQKMLSWRSQTTSQTYKEGTPEARTKKLKKKKKNLLWAVVNKGLYTTVDGRKEFTVKDGEEY